MKAGTCSRWFVIFGIAILSLYVMSLTPTSAGSESLQGAAGILDSTPVKFDRLDPSIDQIVPKGAMLERLADGFKWVEGPVWAGDSLFFAEIPSNSIRRWTPGFGREHLSSAQRLQRLRALRRPRIRIERHDARRARPPHRRRPRTARCISLRVAQREGADHHPRRLVPGQEAQQPQRSRLQVRRFALLHRSALRPAHAEGRRSRQAAQGQRRLSHPPRTRAEARQRRRRAPNCNSLSPT